MWFRLTRTTFPPNMEHKDVFGITFEQGRNKFQNQ